jgi:hypothetical protein
MRVGECEPSVTLAWGAAESKTGNPNGSMGIGHNIFAKTGRHRL